MPSDPRLGKAASAFIDDTIAKGNQIGVSAITLAEIGMTGDSLWGAPHCTFESGLNLPTMRVLISAC